MIYLTGMIQLANMTSQKKLLKAIGDERVAISYTKIIFGSSHERDKWKQRSAVEPTNGKREASRSRLIHRHRLDAEAEVGHSKSIQISESVPERV